MTTLVEQPPRTTNPTAATNLRRGGVLLATLGVLLAVCLLSPLLGTRGVSPATVWDALFHYAGTDDQSVVRDLRVPRTVLGLLGLLALTQPPAGVVTVALGGACFAWMLARAARTS